MRDALRAGIAIYNDGHYHAAHDAWEDRWLELDADTADERLLHGLIQFTAAVYHARNRNWEGTVGLAEGALEYLDELSATYRDVGLSPVRAYLECLAVDPEVIERREPIRIPHDGETPGLEDLDVAETVAAAAVLAEELGYDDEPVETVGEYALADLEAGRDDSRFIALSFAFVRDAENRAVVYRRLSGHVDRRRSREGDVEGLF